MLPWSPAISPAPLLPPRTEQSPAMGRRKFRLSDMIPNAWFYKLRDMRTTGRGRGRGRGAMHQQSYSSSSPSSRGNRFQQPPPTPRNGSSALPHRASYYYTTRDREVMVKPPLPALRVPNPAEFVPLAQSPPRNSRRRHRVGPVRTGQQHALDDIGFVPAPSPVLSPALDPVVVDAPGTSSRRRRDMYVEYDGGELRRPAAIVPEDDALHGKVIASKKDIVIDLRAEGMPERVLRPIVTRPVRRRQPDPHEFQLDRHVVVDLADMTPRPSSASEKSSTGNKPRRSSVSSSGLRLKTRSNSPRLAAATARKATATRKSTRPAPAPALADSFAVVKTSEDPRRDFRESMEEMIAVKGIRDGADLEDLLACYLSLNAAEYHDLIVEVFEQIWTSLADVRP